MEFILSAEKGFNGWIEGKWKRLHFKEIKSNQWNLMKLLGEDIIKAI